MQQPHVFVAQIELILQVMQRPTISRVERPGAP